MFTLKYAETLTHPPLCDDPHSSYSACDGSVYMGNLFWANPVDTYIAKGDPQSSEVFEPSFTYHGYHTATTQCMPLFHVCLDVCSPWSTLHAMVYASRAVCRGRYRYIELSHSGPPLLSEPTISSVIGINLRTAAAESATLRFGADPHSPSNLVQKLSNNSWWTEAAALMSIPAGGAAAVASFLAAVLTEIYLRDVCSCQKY
jgi:hypothetical protein